jgi:recombination protein RecT
MSETKVATKDDLRDMLNGMLPELQKMAPKWFNAERVMSLVLAARTNASIAECSKESFVGFMQKCAMTGLEPVGAGGCWPVPFKNRHTGKKELTFIPDYRGLIFLGKKNDVITHAYADIVREGDEFSIEKGDQPRCVHKPKLSNRGETIGAYAVVTLPDGSKHIEWMDVEELEKVRKASKASDCGPWVDWRDEQYKKTVLKRALKPFAGGNPHMQTAINLDNDALGLKDSLREPIAEPKEVTPESVSEPRPATDAPQSVPQNAPPPPQPPKDKGTPPPATPRPTTTPKTGGSGLKDNEVLVTLTNVHTKDGTNKQTGKPWKCWIAYGGDNTRYSTTSKSLGPAMETVADKEVIVEFKQGPYGRDIVNIRMPDDAAQDTPGNADAENRETAEDLPFTV